MTDRDTLRLVANIVGVLVLVAAVAPFVVYAVPAVVGADQGFVVLSGSMEPKMSPGDAVIVREVPPSEIERRDIITFRTDSQTPTTHRVVEVRQTDSGATYVTKGDANEEADRGPVRYEQVIGEVVFVIPFLGHIIQFANTQAGFLALVLTPMALFVLSELWELSKSVRTDESASASASTESSQDAATHTVDTEASTDGSTDEEESDGFTLTRSSLQLLTVLFGLYVPYSGYVAYTTREAWSIGAATATAIGFLFCLVIYLSTRGATGGSGTETRSLDGVVRRGTVPSQVTDRTAIPLDSVDSLIQMALDRDDWVIYDEEQDTYYVTQENALYLHRTTPETDGGAAPSDVAEADATAGEADDDPTEGDDS